MKVLVACEESQAVCKAFREKGHEAYSCDIIDCSGGHPEWHIQQDVLPLLNGNCNFETTDGQAHTIDGKWNLIIAHPPCTYFSNATMVNLGRRDKPNVFNDAWREGFYKKRDKAFDFVMKIWNADCEHIAIENVVGYLSTHFQKPTQYIEPYFFGNPWKKKTCLWLKNLPELKKTNEVKPIGKWVRHHLKNKNSVIVTEPKFVSYA
jgi:site-specific DNA-cytosine methylase